MAKSTKLKSGKTSRIDVGGKVYVRMGASKRAAQIVEDRGYIGRNRRRILRVRYLYPKGEVHPTFEIPVDYVTTPAPRSGIKSRVASR